MSGKVGSITTGIITDGLILNIDAANRASTIPNISTLKTFNTIDTTISGSIVTDATWEGGSSPSFDFDGSDGSIDFNPDSSLDIAGNDFSCGLWFNTTATSVEAGLFNFGAFSNKFTMVFDGTNDYVGFSFNWNTGGSSTYYYNGYTGNNLNDGNWHNYIITKQGTTIQAYIDGNAITFGNLNGSAGNQNAIRIGRWYHGYYDGKISNIFMYNRVLSASEVLHNYNALKGRFD